MPIPPEPEIIRSATRLRPVPLVPEIRLHQAGDPISLWQRTELAAGPGERPERRVQAGPPGRLLRALPHADRITGLVQPDLRDQRHRPEPGAGSRDLPGISGETILHGLPA